jgi:hypothetical protein
VKRFVARSEGGKDKTLSLFGNDFSTNPTKAAGRVSVVIDKQAVVYRS